ncbi:MAG: hypothetical protein WAU01_01840 [Saprospiraceae bacterium]
MDFNLFSWESFGYLSASIAILWLLMRSRVVDRWLHFYFAYSSSKVERILLSVLLFSFIAVNPLLHAILLVAAFLIYNNIIGRGSVKLFPLVETQSVEKNTPPKSGIIYYQLKCSPKDRDMDLQAMYKALNKSIFSFIYISELNKTNIFFDGKDFFVSLSLISPKYINSLMTYLDQQGFDITINENSNKWI